MVTQCLTDLVDVDGCDSSGVTLQREKTARVLQTVHLSHTHTEHVICVSCVCRVCSIKCVSVV